MLKFVGSETSVNPEVRSETRTLKVDSAHAIPQEVFQISIRLAQVCQITHPLGPTGIAQAAYIEGHDDDRVTEDVLSKMGYDESIITKRRSIIRGRVASLRRENFGVLVVAVTPSSSNKRVRRVKYDALTNRMDALEQRIRDLESCVTNPLNTR